MIKPQTVIQPPSRLSLGLQELWQYRELFYFFTWRDIRVKYKQTYLGIAWAVLQPLALMLLFTFVFKNFRVSTGPMKYQIFVLSGIILWNLFQSAVSNASESMITQSGIIKKIYFPRLIIPCSSLLVALFDFLMAFIIFSLFIIFYRQSLSITALLYFPTALVLTLLSSFGIGTFLSALNVKFRDFRYVIPFFLQLLFFATQVIYSMEDIKQTWLQYVLAINPMNGIIELFRAPFTGSFNVPVVLIGMTSTLLFTFAGLFYFRKTEAYFADLS